MKNLFNLYFAVIKRVLVTLGILIQIMSASGTADQQTDRWQSVNLWSNNILSGRLLFLSPASLADEKILIFEFDNRSDTTIDVDQAYLQLDANRFDSVSGKAISTGGLAGGVLYRGQLKPGITRLSGYVCNAASEGLGLPPRGGYSVEMIVHLDVRLTDRRDFTTPSQGTRFHLDWKYPSPSEIESARERLSALLAQPKHTFEHSSQLGSLIVIPEAANSFTADELLDALKGRTDSVDGRNLVVWLIARRFYGDPKVIAYYSEHLSAGDNLALSDIEGNLQLWNPNWVQPLVANFEKGGDSDTLRVLSFHRGDWATNSQDVSSLSAALLKYRPILHKDASSLSAHELYEWCETTKEVGIVGDKALIRVLAPALDDKRIVHHPLTAMATPPDNRICDAALVAILTILDGAPDSAFKQAGVKYWIWETDDKIRFAAFDRVIALTKERLK